MKYDFYSTVSYNRFAELVGQNLIAMSFFLKTGCLVKSTQISFVDSKHIRVCKYKRILNNEVFCCQRKIYHKMVSGIQTSHRNILQSKNIKILRLLK
jgi:hypothetical protein